MKPTLIAPRQNSIAMQVWLGKPISNAELLEISICERFALSDLALGTDHLEPWRILRDVAIVTLTMARGGVGPEAQTTAQQALDLLHRMYSSSAPMTREEVYILSETLLWHDAQRSKVSRKTFLSWLEKTSESYNAK